MNEAWRRKMSQEEMKKAEAVLRKIEEKRDRKKSRRKPSKEESKRLAELHKLKRIRAKLKRKKIEEEKLRKVQELSNRKTSRSAVGVSSVGVGSQKTYTNRYNRNNIAFVNKLNDDLRELRDLKDDDPNSFDRFANK